MRVAMIYGEFSSAIHGPFDVEGLYTRVGLTGSESSFFNLARSLSDRGHEVVAFCACGRTYELSDRLCVIPVASIAALREIRGVDAVIAWNEPEYLQFAPAGARRYCDQQLNDWIYCRDPNWQDLVDHFVFPSEHSRQHHVRDEGLAKAEPCGSVVPNSVDLGLFSGPAPERERRRVVWCSSPDRGLHHLLGMWPEIRRAVPGAELRIFYRLAAWMARARDAGDEVGRRARYIETALPRLVGYGVTVVDLVPNAQMARELREATVLAYPCDPVKYTEGFGCSVLDAAAAGCIPVISDADALPSVHGDSAAVIHGRPSERRSVWVENVAAILQLGGTPPEWSDRMASHAERHSRQAVARRWEDLLGSTV